MWSGPRNISTAMMRAWGNRPDTFVCDEPLYAHYLLITGKDHPGRDEVIAAHETDWRKVAALLTGPTPGGKRIFYQKQMTHHLLPNIDRGWLAGLTHAFLIRHPREVILSYLRKNTTLDLPDTGFPQQVEIFDWVSDRAAALPPVVDARDVLEDPRRTLGRLCEALGVPFLDSMLSWPPGPRPTDGAWARHWYAEVERSTSFQPYSPSDDPVPPALAPIYDQCMPLYERLYSARLR